MKKTNYSYNFRLFLAYLKSIGIFFGIAILLSVPMMLLWNWLMPFIFGLPKLNLIQTVGLSLLSNMIMSKPPQNIITAEKSVDNDLDNEAMQEYYESMKEMEQKYG